MKNTRSQKDFKAESFHISHERLLVKRQNMIKANAFGRFLVNTCPFGQKFAFHRIKQLVGQDLDTFTRKKIMKNQKMASNS